MGSAPFGLFVGGGPPLGAATAWKPVTMTFDDNIFNLKKKIQYKNNLNCTSFWALKGVGGWVEARTERSCLVIPACFACPPSLQNFAEVFLLYFPAAEVRHLWQGFFVVLARLARSLR